MIADRRWDAVVVGSGPNGLAAALTLARAGKAVLVLEAADTPGGGCRSAELTLPGFTHDVCSAVHPLGVASPFFQEIGLSDAVEWVYPEIELAHPLDGGVAAALYRSIDQTAEGLGRDGDAWRSLVGPIVRDFKQLAPLLLGPLRLPRDPIAATRFGFSALRSIEGLARARFRDAPARALLAGSAAHPMLRLSQPTTAAFGLILSAIAHIIGWPVAKGGSQAIVNAMVTRLRALGGEVITGQRVDSLADLADTEAILLDVTPEQALAIAGERFSWLFRHQLGRYRYGPGVFKMDWALDGPVPWVADACRHAITVHLGGTMEEIAASEAAVHRGEHPDRPFVLVSQPSLFDDSRAPAGKHTLWAYCHVPSGSTEDMTERIEAQLERFAPGFRQLILARSTMNTHEMQAYNPNYIGGDINGGLQDIRQLFTRPTPRLTPYLTSADGVYLCSSATPPGGGVHGMCGFHAAHEALRRMR